MTPYKSKSGKESGVEAYEIGTDFIKVLFKGWVYHYTYGSAGQFDIEEMKSRATDGKGLSTYISQHDPPYETKYPYYPRQVA